MTKLHELSGLITSEVGEALAELASKVPESQAIVEVGSHKGQSTAWLAHGAKSGHGAKVFAVDPWDLPGNVAGKHGYNKASVRDEFERQLKSVRLWSRVTPIQAFSPQAAEEWDGPKIGLLFVDADHAEAAVRADVEAWRPHLAARHVIALDDLDTPRNPGVRIVADELASGGYTLSVEAGRLGVLRP